LYKKGFDMKTIAVSELRANLMKVLKKIEGGECLHITSHGKVVARLVPPDQNRGTAKERLREIGKTAKLLDVVSPIDAEWDADT
jgi:prevent-host-death family protein